MTRKKTGGPKSSAQVWNHRKRILPPIPSRSKGTTQVWKLISSRTRWGKDSRRLDTAMWRWPRVVAPILRWVSKRCLTLDVLLWRRNQRTSTLELQQKTRKKILCLCLLSFFPHYMLFLWAQFGRLSFRTLFLSPWRLLRKCSSE